MARLTQNRRLIGTVIASATRTAVLDATLSDAQTRTVKWTTHPIEDGSEIQDHGTEEQVQYTLTGRISRTTLGTVLVDDPLRLETTRDTLSNMLSDKEPISIINGVYALENYVISSLVFTRGEGQGQSLDVSMTLLGLVTTSTATIVIPPELVFDDFGASFTSLELGGAEVPGESDGTEIKDEVESSIVKSGYNFLSGR